MVDSSANGSPNQDAISECMYVNGDRVVWALRFGDARTTNFLIPAV